MRNDLLNGYKQYPLWKTDNKVRKVNNINKYKQEKITINDFNVS